MKILNSKHLPARSRFGEGRRNPKQYRMNKIQNLKRRIKKFRSFEISDFGFKEEVTIIEELSTSKLTQDY